MVLFNKRVTAIAVSLFLMFAMAISLVALPSATAQSSGEKTSYAYIFAAPNPVGVGQRVYISMLVDFPLPEAEVPNNIRRHDYKLTITTPDEKTETFEWDVIQDTTGVAFMSYTPNEAGEYTLKFDYAGQTYEWDDTPAQQAWYGVKFLPASRTITLVVQEDPLPDPIGSYPLPTEYWTRPIEGENNVWNTISSHWLGGSFLGANNVYQGFGLYQRSGVGPEAPHIMWTKPIEFGGVVGGVTSIPGETFYSGGSYEGRFNNALIMQGILYYTVPLGHSGSGGGYAALDLRTGEELWHREDLGGLTETGYYTPISKAQIYTFDTENQHGAGGGLLWGVIGNTWMAYDGFTGKWVYNLTDVPSGFEVVDERGMIVRYVLDYDTEAESGWMALWNFSEAAGARGGVGGYRWNQWRPNGRNINTSEAYSWNVTINADLTGNSRPSIVAVLPGDVILGISSNVGPSVGRFSATPDPYTVWAISDDPDTRGRLLWKKSYPAPSGNLSRTLGPVDPVNRVWTMSDAETFQWLGYDLDDGSPLWGPTNFELRDIQFFAGGEGAGQRGLTAYGNIYVQGYGGELFAFSTKNGTMLWKYNNTDSGLETPWGLRPIFVAAVCDDKVYAFNNEHSPNTPLYKDNKIYCINATTGDEIYTMLGWAGQVGGRGLSTSVLADGTLVYYNYYDNSIYAIAKGPSATTVSIQNDVTTQGNKVLVKGSVTDISAGTTQDEQAARFPNGVPAVSDESMGEWMQYVYMQKPRPTNVTGVEVIISVLDPNNNCYEVATITSDADGFFQATFEPPVPGEYTVYATFEGSASYWPSNGQTGLFVEDALEATAEPTPVPQAPVEMYFTASTIAIIVAIAIVAFLILRRH
jgi:outer membrane protein assembly factor BamB